MKFYLLLVVTAMLGFVPRSHSYFHCQHDEYLTEQSCISQCRFPINDGSRAGLIPGRCAILYSYKPKNAPQYKPIDCWKCYDDRHSKSCKCNPSSPNCCQTPKVQTPTVPATNSLTTNRKPLDSTTRSPHIFEWQKLSGSPVVNAKVREYMTTDTDDLPDFKTPDMDELPDFTTPGMDEEPDFTTPDMDEEPEFTTPGMDEEPDFTTPDMDEEPDFTTPDMDELPDFTTPGMDEEPDFTTPDMDELPDFTTPDMDELPDFTTPADSNSQPLEDTEPEIPDSDSVPPFDSEPNIESDEYDSSSSLNLPENFVAQQLNSTQILGNRY